METGIVWNNPMIYVGIASVSLAFLGLVITAGIALFKAGKWVNGMNALKETVVRIEGKVDRLMEHIM